MKPSTTSNRRLPRGDSPDGVNTPTIKRLALVYENSLGQLRIRVSKRSPFSTEYQNLVGMERDFDLTSTLMAQRPVPGAEFGNQFGSQAADRPYSRNTAGIKSPTIDSLIEAIVAARSRE